MPKLPDWETLDAVRQFLSTIVYARESVLDALTATIAVTHAPTSFAGSLPRFLVTSKYPNVGKTTLSIHAPALLVRHPWKVGRLTTEYALSSKFTDENTPNPTLLFDDAGKVFGDSGMNGRGSKLYSISIDGYIKTGTVSLSVNRVATDVSCFGVMFINGLHNAVPGDVRTRSIRVEAIPRPEGIRLENALSASVEADAVGLREALHSWVTGRRDFLRAFSRDELDRIHSKLVDREQQIWGPLFTIAAAAGGTWPDRIMSAFLTLGLDQSDRPSLTTDQQILVDTADILIRAGVDRIFSADLVAALRRVPDRPFYQDASRDYLLKKLSDVLGAPKTIRGTNFAGEAGTGKGRMSAPILRQAAELKAALYDDAGPRMPSEADLEMEFTPRRK